MLPFFSKKLILKKENVVYDIGRTKLLVEFVDGSKGYNFVYGTFCQCDIKEPEITDSRTNAKQHLKNFSDWDRNDKSTFVDDIKNPNILFRGYIKNIELGDTESYKEAFNVIRIVE